MRKIRLAHSPELVYGDDEQEIYTWEGETGQRWNGAGLYIRRNDKRYWYKVQISSGQLSRITGRRREFLERSREE